MSLCFPLSESTFLCLNLSECEAFTAGLAVSSDGTLLVSISNDKSIKVFDVANIDMMAMLRLPYVPACAEWVYRVRSHHDSLAPPICVPWTLE